MVITGVIVVAVIVAILFLVNKGGVQFSPTDISITRFMDNLQSDAESYTLVVSDEASGKEIASVSKFAGTFGVLESEKFSEVTSGSSKLVYFLTSSVLQEDYSFVLTSNDILVTTARSADLLDEAIQLLIDGDSASFTEESVVFTSGLSAEAMCGDGTAFASCSATKPEICEVNQITKDGVSLILNDDCQECGCGSGLVCGSSGICESPTAFAEVIVSSLTINQGETGTVEVTVKPKKQVNGLLVALIIPPELLVSGLTPNPLVMIDGNQESPPEETNIVWSDSDSKTRNINEEVIYRFDVDSSTSGLFTINGRAEASNLVDGEEVYFVFDVQVNCDEIWSCDVFSPATCPASGERTRTCTDAGACGTTNDKPAEMENCQYQPRCVETGDSGFDIDVAGTVTFDDVAFSDSCDSSTKQITEYACLDDDNMDSVMVTRCDVCSVDGTSCSQERTCQANEAQAFTCNDGTIISDYYICNVNGDGFIRNPVSTECPPDEVEINDALDNILGNSVKPIGIVGAKGVTTDRQGMIGIAGKFGITDVRVDNEILVSDIVGEVILVGGPCVNDFVQELYNQGKFRYSCSGANGWPGGGNIQIADYIEDGFGSGKNVLVVAGTRAEDTLELARTVRDHASNRDMFRKLLVCGNVGIGAVCDGEGLI